MPPTAKADGNVPSESCREPNVTVDRAMSKHLN